MQKTGLAGHVLCVRENNVQAQEKKKALMFETMAGEEIWWLIVFEELSWNAGMSDVGSSWLWVEILLQTLDWEGTV